MREIKKIVIIFSFGLSCSLWCEEGVFKDLKGKHSKIIENYFKIHQKMSKETCSEGAENLFWNKFKTYRKVGFFIPTHLDKKLDLITLNKFIPEVERKIGWIKKKISSVKKIKKNDQYEKIFDEIDERIKKLLSYKESYNENQDYQARVKVKSQSRNSFLILKKKILGFLDSIHFLLSYRYPVNHFELRESYDEVKYTQDKQKRLRRNEIYFYRRIVQDGAQNTNGTKNDRFMRAGLDAIYYNLQEKSDFLSEKTHFNIVSGLKIVRRQLSYGLKYHLVRLEEWRERTERMLSFYRQLKANKVKFNGEILTAQQFILSKDQGTESLQNFNSHKQRAVYQFWAKQDPLLRAIFVIETILFNEVGNYEKGSRVERRDVTQVVINRSHDPKYNYIPSTDTLHSYLASSETTESIKTNPWLNVLFKEGEFSFSYFFIDGSVRIYCPDQTRSGQRLRRKNIQIALRLLENPNKSFQGIRYFSRGSMLGKVDMSLLWDDLEEIPERPGEKIEEDQHLKKSYEERDYTYYYHFLDAREKRFKVIRIGQKTYVLDPESMQFFKYRNPHYFRYFRVPRGGSS